MDKTKVRKPGYGSKVINTDEERKEIPKFENQTVAETLIKSPKSENQTKIKAKIRKSDKKCPKTQIPIFAFTENRNVLIRTLLLIIKIYIKKKN